MYAIATAYSGTGNNSAIRRLLHVAVSDVSDDVRRAAVTCIGFVLTTIPEQCPRVVSLLAESYNPHVRYGSTVRLVLYIRACCAQYCVVLCRINMHVQRERERVTYELTVRQYSQTNPKSCSFHYFLPMCLKYLGLF